MFLEDLGPDLELVVVDDGDAEEAGVQHLEQVFVFEVLWRRTQDDRCLACLLEPGVELLEVLPVARRLPDEDFLARKIVDRGELRRLRTRHHDLVDRFGRRRHREIDDFVALGRDREARGDDVAQPGEQVWHQLLARGRKEDDVDLQGAPLLVELILERLEGFVGEPSRLPALDEVHRLGVGDEHPNDPPLDHRIEVTGPRLRSDLQRGGLRLCRRSSGRRRGARRRLGLGRDSRRYQDCGQEGHRECGASGQTNHPTIVSPTAESGTPAAGPTGPGACGILLTIAMASVRRHLASLGLAVLLGHVVMQVLVPAALCCQKPLAAGTRAEAHECCPQGAHPGKVCPMHANRAAKPTSPDSDPDCTARASRRPARHPHDPVERRRHADSPGHCRPGGF